MKVSELDGAQLSYWVAKAENWPSLNWANGRPMTQAEWIAAFPDSVSWPVAGPIIERERISIKQCEDGGCYAYFDHKDGSAAGETPIIAAMRASVASRLGDEVPDSAIDAPPLKAGNLEEG